MFASNVEKIHVGARTGTSLSTLIRGVDNTTAASHVAGETVRVIFPALEAHQASEHAGNPAIDDHTQYLNTARHAAVSHTQAMLGSDSVGAAQLQANSVGTSELADNSVDTNAIQALAVTAAKIANDTITATQIAPDAVGTSEIAADAVTSSEIAADAVGSSELANNAVDTAAIADDAVTFAKVNESGFPATTAATVLTGEGTVSGVYADLATVGPAVTMTPPASGKVIVHLYCHADGDGTTNQSIFMGFEMSGGTALAAGDTRAIGMNLQSGGNFTNAGGATFLMESLAASSTTFTAKYRSSGGAGATFANRRIIVQPVLA
jgi:hypothetical protein